MDIIEESYKHLFPDREFDYTGILKYSRQFSDYNANVRQSGRRIEFKLSRKFRDVSKEIRMGVIQELMLKLWKPDTCEKENMSLLYVDLYNSFVKNLHIAVSKTQSDPLLAASFSRVNDRYFHGLIEQPNLAWSKDSRSQMGCYHYKTDLITISPLLKEADPLLMDLVMHHEMLHKDRKFSHAGGRNRYHSTEFRQREREFENFEELHRQLNSLSRRPERRLGKARPNLKSFASWLFR